MKLEAKQKWIDALRSGNYKQGKGFLRGADNKYCCLGVLCELYIPDEWGKEAITSINGPDICYATTNERTGFLPDKLGLDLCLPNSVQTILVKKNDSGFTFKEIADWIEENL